MEGLETDNERGEQIQTEIYKESVKTERDKERKRDREGGGLRDRSERGEQTHRALQREGKTERDQERKRDRDSGGEREREKQRERATERHRDLERETETVEERERERNSEKEQQ